MQLKGKLIQNSCFMFDNVFLCQAALERIIIIIIIKVKISFFAPDSKLAAQTGKTQPFTKCTFKQSYSQGKKSWSSSLDINSVLGSIDQVDPLIPFDKISTL